MSRSSCRSAVQTGNASSPTLLSSREDRRKSRRARCCEGRGHRTEPYWYRVHRASLHARDGTLRAAKRRDVCYSGERPTRSYQRFNKYGQRPAFRPMLSNVKTLSRKNTRRVKRKKNRIHEPRHVILTIPLV